MNRKHNPRHLLVACLLLASVTLVAYWPVLNCEFIHFDDPDYVVENEVVKRGITVDGIQWALKTGHAGNWHPVTWLSHMADAQCYQLSPAGHHATSLLFHVANSVLVLLLVLQLTGAFWRSVFVAAVFALHPVHVESVAWVSERKDVLSTFFGLLTLMAYAKYVGHSKIQSPKSKVWYGGALMLFALGLMSKPMLVTWPFLMLLLDFWPLGRTTGIPVGTAREVAGRGMVWVRLVLEKLPFLGLAITSSIVTFLVQQQQGAVAPRGLPLDSRIANAVLSYMRYVEKLVWPENLAVFYPHPATVSPELKDWITIDVGIAAVFLVCMTVAAVWRWRQTPYLAVGWFLFAGTLVPVIGLVQVGGQAMADRYVYFPMLGIVILLTWLLAEVFQKFGAKPLYVGFAGFGLLATLGMLSRNQAGHWRNDETVFGHAMRVTAKNATAHLNYGATMALKGKLDEAMLHYRKAIEFDPFLSDAHFNLGRAFAGQGKLNEAEAEYRATIKIQPDHVLAHNNLGGILHYSGRTDEAAKHYAEAVRFKPGFSLGHLNLGRLNADRGDYDKATACFKEALRINPNSGEAETGIGLALLMQRNHADALVHLRRAVELSPNSPEAHINLGNALSERGQPDLAQVSFETALRLQPELVQRSIESGDAMTAAGQSLPALARYSLAVQLAPGNAEAREKLGILFLRQGQTQAAITNLIESVRLSPTAQAHFYLATALAIGGQPAEARNHYAEAIRLKPDWPEALNDYAWLLAAHPDPALRDGRKAVELAEKACKLSSGVASFNGTLDAAYAQAGRFAEAIATAEKTIAMAKSSGQPELAAAAEQRLLLYRQGKSYHQGIENR